MGIQEVRNFWETCGTKYAHLDSTKGRDLGTGSSMLETFAREFINKIAWKDKVVVDYGIGGGYWGKYLLQQHKIAKYIGLDIAQRSVNKAKEVLSLYPQPMWQVERVDALSDFIGTGDILTSFACIQHFPSEEYFKNFLDAIALRKFETVVLQIRYDPHTIFSNPYTTKDGNVGLACKTNVNYIQKYLSQDYAVSYFSRFYESGYQYLILKRKNSPSFSVNDKKYEDFIKGKEVVFVAPGRTLEGKTLGNEIDKFDVVIRTNGAFNLLWNEEYTKDYGSRCDVLYTNAQFVRESKPIEPEKILEKQTQFFCGKLYPTKVKELYEKYVRLRVVSEAINKVNNYRIRGALMGMIAITDILSFFPKRLKIMGMDFYVTKPKEFIPGDYREYVKGYLPEEIQKIANVRNLGKSDDHEIFSNTEYLSKLCSAYPGIIEICPYSKVIMDEILSHPGKYLIIKK